MKPKLLEKGLIFVKNEWTGFFSNGDFNNEEFTFGSSGAMGKSSISIYFYVYYLEGSVNKRVTVRIDTSMLSIKQISFSHDV